MSGGNNQIHSIQRRLMKMTNAILEEIVNEQLISALGLVTPDGRPHCTPVWVHHYSGKLYIFSRSGRAKVKYAEMNRECMIAFDFASLRGEVDIIHKQNEEYQQIKDLPDARYGDDSQLEFYKENWDIALKITPTRLYR